METRSGFLPLNEWMFMQIFRTLGKHKPSRVLRHNGGRKRKALAQEGVVRFQVLHGLAPPLQGGAHRCTGGGSCTTGVPPSLRGGSSLSSTGLSRCRGSPVCATAWLPQEPTVGSLLSLGSGGCRCHSYQGWPSVQDPNFPGALKSLIIL